MNFQQALKVCSLLQKRPSTALHKRIPRTPQGTLQTPDGCQKNVQFPCLNFLNSSRIDVRFFRKPLLSQTARNTLATDIGSEDRETGMRLLSRHALLGRNICLQNTAQWGVT